MREEVLLSLVFVFGAYLAVLRVCFGSYMPHVCCGSNLHIPGK